MDLNQGGVTMANTWAERYLKALEGQGHDLSSIEELDDFSELTRGTALLSQASSPVQCRDRAVLALKTSDEEVPSELIADLVSVVEDCDYQISSAREQIAYLQGATRTEPCNGGAHAALGFLLLKLDQREEAANCFRKALESVDSLCFLCRRDCTNNLGWDRYERGDYPGALHLFEQACWLRPGSSGPTAPVPAPHLPEPPYRLAMENILLCLARLGQLPKALQCLERYIEHFGRLPYADSEALKEVGLNPDIAYIRAMARTRANGSRHKVM
jgi:tetratricopeptide (TPR) repeat protein